MSCSGTNPEPVRRPARRSRTPAARPRPPARPRCAPRCRRRSRATSPLTRISCRSSERSRTMSALRTDVAAVGVSRASPASVREAARLIGQTLPPQVLGQRDASLWLAAGRELRDRHEDLAVGRGGRSPRHANRSAIESHVLLSSSSPPSTACSASTDCGGTRSESVSFTGLTRRRTRAPPPSLVHVRLRGDRLSLRGHVHREASTTTSVCRCRLTVMLADQRIGPEARRTSLRSMADAGLGRGASAMSAVRSTRTACPRLRPSGQRQAEVLELPRTQPGALHLSAASFSARTALLELLEVWPRWRRPPCLRSSVHAAVARLDLDLSPMLPGDDFLPAGSLHGLVLDLKWLIDHAPCAHLSNGHAEPIRPARRR